MMIVIFALILVGLILICVFCAIIDENTSILHPVWAGEMLLGRVRFDKKTISTKPVSVLKGEDNLKASPKDYFSVYIAGGNILFSGKKYLCINDFRFNTDVHEGSLLVIESYGIYYLREVVRVMEKERAIYTKLPGLDSTPKYNRTGDLDCFLVVFEIL